MFYPANRFGIFGVMFLLFLSAGLVRVLAAPMAVCKVKGDAQVLKNGATAWIPVEKGMILESGDEIRTGKKGKLVMKRKATKLTLYSESNFRVASWVEKDDRMEARMELSLGKLKAKVKRLKADESFEIVTPTSTAAVRGTTFVLWVYEMMGRLFTQLDVLDDIVEFTDLSHHEAMMVGAGYQVTGGIDGISGPPAPLPGMDLHQQNQRSSDPRAISDEVSAQAGFEQDTPGSQDNVMGSPINEAPPEEPVVRVDG